MRRFIIETSYTDGFRCERHHVDAETVEGAVQLALDAAGTAEDSWVVVECGETVVDSVVELRGEEELEWSVEENLAEPAHREAPLASELAHALRMFIRDCGSAAPAETLHGALSVLAKLDKPS